MTILDAIRELFAGKMQMTIPTNSGVALQLTPISPWLFRLRILRRLPEEPTQHDLDAVCAALDALTNGARPHVTVKEAVEQDGWTWFPLLVRLPVFQASHIVGYHQQFQLNSGETT